MFRSSDFGIFYLGSFAVHWYSIFVFLGIVAVMTASLLRAKFVYKISLEPIENFIFIALPVCLIGARLWYVLGDLQQFNSIWEVFDLWQGGLAIEGAVLAGLVAGFFWFRFASKYYETPLSVYFDVIVPNLLLAQAIGRWGNFFNQEILGPIAPSGLFWLPEFIRDHLHYSLDPTGTVRHPLFLYESCLNLLGWGLIIFVLPKITKINLHQLGSSACCYLIWYGLIRFVLEFWRTDVNIMHIGPIPFSTLISAWFFAFGVLIIFYLNYVRPMSISRFQNQALKLLTYTPIEKSFSTANENIKTIKQ